jgi:hypothetical protein
VKVQQKREVAEKESAAELAHKAGLAQSQKQFEVRRENLLRLCRELCPATPPLPECVSHFAFVLQSTLHQKLMSNKANTYYSELKVRS